MTDGDEIAKALCRLFTEIAERERKKAIQKDDYGTALIASFAEGFFKEAERSIN